MAGGFLTLSSCASALTNNQVISFIIAVTICFLFMMTGVEIIQAGFKDWAPIWVTKTLANLSIMTNFNAISQGVIDARNIFYFLSLIVIGLAINSKIIDIKKV